MSFLNRPPKVQEIKPRINKCDGLKLKSFFSAKEMISNVKREPIDWEKIFTTYISDKALISGIYEEFKILTT